jgi:enamine deaminase RidA (YjgF/YER057c/UK114 family)
LIIKKMNPTFNRRFKLDPARRSNFLTIRGKRVIFESGSKANRIIRRHRVLFPMIQDFVLPVETGSFRPSGSSFGKKSTRNKEAPMSAEKKLKELGILLPQPPQPVANYVRAVKTGNLLFVSGHGPYQDGKIKISGKVGKELTIEEGYQVARNVGLNCLASVKATLGDLDKVKRVVKLLGMVNCTEDFKDQPKVINGCSDLLVEVFGDAGKHARSAVGMQALPNGIPVEIEMILEVA